ncbi:MAG: methyltransferase domain-containing protein [Candidatus Heimdallarchaeota archaeon]|nr:methyltransferase domain-containing protein [Candidatus Heimdallarchaeota archaeon]MDH5646660.1 methyltransferase domain-containing protein [Candidatus Heimdallarchaeota archaeon]
MNNEELSKQQFGKVADKYVTSRIHSDKEDLDFIVYFINPNKSWSMLDIATGTGHLAHKLAPEVSKVIASDITQEMLTKTAEIAIEKKITNLSTQSIDAHEIPFEANSFDLVTSRIAPHHFSDINKAIKNMISVTKQGGYIFIQDTKAPEEAQAAKFINKIEKLRDKSHLQTYSKLQWMKFFEGNDCTIEKMHVKTKVWPLGWWTERMNTPEQDINAIISLIEENHHKYTSETTYHQEENEWIITTQNIYVLARKN